MFQFGLIERCGIDAGGSPLQRIGTAGMRRVGDGGQERGMSLRPADILRRTATGCLQQQRHTGGVGILEPALELDDVLPIVAEVIEIADGLRPGVPDDVVEPGFARIDRLALSE